MSLLRRLFAVRSVESIVQRLDTAPPLNRVLTASSLTAIGLGSMIGTGIFVFTGQVAAQNAGPALTIALLIAALGAGLAAICYAEFAAMIPVSGSAYSYTYATLGEATAWFIGWNLSLEYLMSASAVAVSWSAYVVDLLGRFGVELPSVLTNAPLAKVEGGGLMLTGAIMNVPAVAIVAALGWILYIGMRESSWTNTAMVAIKIGVIVVFVLVGWSYVDPDNWRPYLPPNTGTPGQFGLTGLLQGAAIIFFSYIGFDAASTTARETRNPQRDVPIGILAALIISAVLYVAMATVMTGMVHFTQLGVANPVSVALNAHPEISWLGELVEVGVIIGMTSVILMSLLGQPRILLAMAEDGLLPQRMAAVHPTHRTPHVATVITTVLAALVAGAFPLDVLGELIVIGILLAFTMVCIGVLVLRYTKPDIARPFRVPLAPVTCVLGAVVCGGMTYFLPADTWWRLLVWTILGFSIYAAYGYRHSKLRTEQPGAEQP
ncbi:MAG TPA: amino acid permease [Steroidobacter sp.]|jgi:APA family basic amino acid/polyamine antiporter|nr:amino acid permease [Steroidobacteraceae bacterium]HLS80743.1 amino acid permease [Steroidobacter sp.]